MGGFELKESSELKTDGENGEKEDAFAGVSTKTRTWRHGLIGLVTFLYFSGMNMGIFIIGQYIYRRIQVETYPNKTFVTGVSYCAYNRSDPDVLKLANVQKKASEYNVIFAIIAGVPSVFINILAGSFTDKFGRKFLLLVSMVGTLLRNVICLIGIYITMDINLFGIAFGIEGFMGQVFAYLLASYAYVADITTRKDRAIGIIYNEVAIGLATSLPSFGAGYFLQAYGFKYPFILAVALGVLAILITITLLPESFPKHKRERPTKMCMNLRHSVEFYYASWNYGFRWKYIVVMLVFYISMVNVLGRGGVETLYQLNAPFCWDPQKLGLFTALRALLQQIFGMVMVILLKRFINDDTIAIIGSVFMGASFVIEGLAKTDTVIYIVTVVGSLGMLAVPMTRSIMSQMTSPDRQGALTASISVIETICFFTATVMLNAIYHATVAKTRGAVFFVMAGFNVLSLLLLIMLKLGSRNSSEDGVPRKSSVRPVSYFEKN